MQSGRVVATLAFSGEEKLAINIPATGTSFVLNSALSHAPNTRFCLHDAVGKTSDSIVNLKKEVVGFLSQHMAVSNLANDEGEACTSWC